MQVHGVFGLLETWYKRVRINLFVENAASLGEK